MRVEVEHRPGMAHGMHQMHDRSSFLLNAQLLKVPENCAGAPNYDRRLSVSATCGRIIEALGQYNELHLMTGTADAGQHASDEVFAQLNSGSADTLASDTFPYSSGCVQELLHGEGTRLTKQSTPRVQAFQRSSSSEASEGQGEELMDHGVGRSPALSHRLNSRGNLELNSKFNEPSLPWMPVMSSASIPRTSPMSGISSLSLAAISGGAPSGAYWSLLQDLSSPASGDGSIDYSDSHSRQPQGNTPLGNQCLLGSQANDPCSLSDSQTQSEVDNVRRRLYASVVKAGQPAVATKVEGLKDVELDTKGGSSSDAPGMIMPPEKEAAGESGTDCSDDQDEMDVKPVVMAGSRGRRRQYSCGTASKNLVSERKRRKRLNDGLYALRALVPKISKMDKASIVGDAIDYVRELQQQVENLRSDISQIEANGHSPPYLGEQECEVTENACQRNEVDGSLHEPQQRLLQLEISRVDRGVFQLRVFCRQGPGVLVQIMQALEASGLDVLNANLTCFKENVLNTFIAEMKDGEMEEEEVRSTILRKAAQFGLLNDTAQ